MRIVAAEPQLLKDFIDEIDVSVCKESQSYTVHGGRHPILGKVVVIESKGGDSLIVEVDE